MRADAAVSRRNARDVVVQNRNCASVQRRLHAKPMRKRFTACNRTRKLTSAQSVWLFIEKMRAVTLRGPDGTDAAVVTKSVRLQGVLQLYLRW